MMVYRKHYKYFQIKLPSNVDRIVGVEVGAFKLYSTETYPGFWDPFGEVIYLYPPSYIKDLFQVKSVKTIGSLSLSSPTDAGCFFEGEIRQEDTAPKYADFTQMSPKFGQWSHDRNRYEMNIDVIGNTIIEGKYKDNWGDLNRHYSVYDLYIYITITTK
jgi:hypothetical protein